jgi:hypothetical protein
LRKTEKQKKKKKNKKMMETTTAFKCVRNSSATTIQKRGKKISQAKRDTDPGSWYSSPTATRAHENQAIAELTIGGKLFDR